ncbi:multidrug efflux system outer membrane protein [Pedobacter sp. CG_S7]|uniref:efflux transporter outer membrane subunit n=1 Tax=Pedobacter sp. CG_S7 TaxID=3143930 RepID=UPI003390E7C0
MTDSYKKQIFTTMFVVLTLSACKITNKYERPNLKTEGLYRDQKSIDTTVMADLPWQNLFADVTLKELIQEGLDQNIDLKNAVQNIIQAQATLRQNKLAFLPSLTADASAARNKTSEAGLNFPPGININTLTNTFLLQLSTSWEADIWGKISSSKRVALASYLQTDAAKRAVQTQLIATIANNYYSLIALDRQLEITEITLKKRIENVETMKALKEAAVVNGAAVVQSEANRYAAAVSIPDLKQSIRITENVLSLLLARVPGHINRNKLSKQQSIATLTTGVAAQLLQNRPDVQAAEFAFRASFEDANLARTYFYPTLTLTARSGFSNLELKDFFSNAIFYNLLAGITQPIFAKGVNKARLTRALAIQTQTFNDFQQTLLIAGQEVSNALYAYQMASEKESLRAKQIIALEKAVNFTEELLRYSSATNYTDVLTSEQSLLAAQLAGVNDRLQQLQAVVNLYQALGGGWK